MPFTVVPIDSNFFNELSELLSQLRIKAEMALDGHWNRCHEGYIAQIDDVNSFAKKFEIPLYYSSTQEDTYGEDTGDTDYIKRQTRSTLHKIAIAFYYLLRIAILLPVHL